MPNFNVIIEKDEEGYFVSEVVGLPGCHTQAKSIDELIERTKEAIALYIECEKPELSIQSKFIGIQQIEV
ncbi:MAG: type II toxin-antitoxin system HicB family antitoxin [archaeon]